MGTLVTDWHLIYGVHMLHEGKESNAPFTMTIYLLFKLAWTSIVQEIIKL